ncbi:3-hydroxybutyryl-CoA dehydrogenase [Tepidibacter hydrothermalis]|uniref:3-hydroxybutyryl-CoA dehydrogenase n=1 Tax=Tepidibacter hydrothermalis TaxID=3036126 RepID=A0ABY8EET6_9FIRM|nr:3-hydroxybutyryl-CoA dehydrogenase [Tepidibacter hydrothermalis]WFD11469.1 3-hydroxybutyryl-CoA dehydrogenase [Tepidibacter hydrothermalis]
MKIGVIGTGTMGSGIAQVFIEKGYEVILNGISESEIKNGFNIIDKNLDRKVKKEKITLEDKEAILEKLNICVEIDELKECDIVVEAIVENMEVKKELFKKLDEVVKEDTILATNTSSLSITEIALSTKRPDKVIGMHFFNPAPVMKLVEIIEGVASSQETVDKVHELCNQISKDPVMVKEAPGFIVNRILVPMINEAIGILGDGIATKEEIDKAMKLGAGHPMGPLELSDLIGNDVVLFIMEVLHKEFGDDKYRPHTLLKKMVRGNLLGRKTKNGFYKY